MNTLRGPIDKSLYLSLGKQDTEGARGSWPWWFESVSIPTQEPSFRQLLCWRWCRGWHHQNVTDKVFIDRWSLDLIMSICRFQPRQMHAPLVGNNHYQSRTPLSTSGESINRHPQSHQSSLVMQFTKKCSPSSLLKALYSGNMYIVLATQRANHFMLMFRKKYLLLCRQFPCQALQGIAFAHNISAIVTLVKIGHSAFLFLKFDIQV